MSGKAMLRCLVAAAMLAAVAHGQTTVGSALTGQSGSSFPGSCPISKLSDVIVTTVATLPESTTGPLTLAYSAASNFPFGNPVSGFITSPSWTLFLNNTASYFATPNSPSTSGSGSSTGTPLAGGVSGLKFFGECKQNLLTLQATCSFVFDYSTRRLLDLLSKATPAGGIPLGGTLTFQFCTLALGNSQVSSPTCFESRGGAPKPVIVKISSKQPADVIPPIGFNACYKDVTGSPYKCLAFSIVQSCADSSQLAVGAPTSGQPYPGTPTGSAISSLTTSSSGAASTDGGLTSTPTGSAISGPITSTTGAGITTATGTPTSNAGTNPNGMTTLSGGQGSSMASTQTTSMQQGASSLPLSQQVYNQGAQVVGQGAKEAKQQYQTNMQSQQQQGRRLKE